MELVLLADVSETIIAARFSEAAVAGSVNETTPALIEAVFGTTLFESTSHGPPTLAPEFDFISIALFS